MQTESNNCYKSCFQKGYWKDALKEFSNVRSLVVCALITALRIIAQAPYLKIAIVPNELEINFGFLFNAVGSMVYGPLLAVIGGAISDTLGFFLFSTGVYFVPYMFIAMASSFIFALFLYKQELTPLRILLANFTMVVICNLLLSPVALYLYFKIMLGKAKVLVDLILADVAVNLTTYPIKSLLLFSLIRALAMPLAKMNYITPPTKTLKLTKKEIVFLVVLTVIAVVTLVLYVLYLKDII